MFIMYTCMYTYSIRVHSSPSPFLLCISQLLGHSDSKTEDNENDTDVDNDSDKEDNSDNETSDNDSDSEVEEDDGREMEKDNDSGDDVQPENREPGNIADMNEDSNGSTSLQLSEGGHQTESGRREDLQVMWAWYEWNRTGNWGMDCHFVFWKGCFLENIMGLLTCIVEVQCVQVFER